MWSYSACSGFIAQPRTQGGAWIRGYAGSGFMIAVLLMPFPGPLSAAASSVFWWGNLARRAGHCVHCYELEVGKQVEAGAYECLKLGSCTPC